MSTEWAVGLTAILGPVLTLLLTKGVDAWIKYRKQLEGEGQYEDAKVVKGYEFVISALQEQRDRLEEERKGEISGLRVRLDKSLSDHVECIRVQEGLKVLTSELQKQNTEQQKEITNLRHSLDELRVRYDDLRVKVS